MDLRVLETSGILAAAIFAIWMLMVHTREKVRTKSSKECALTREIVSNEVARRLAAGYTSAAVRSENINAPISED